MFKGVVIILGFLCLLPFITSKLSEDNFTPVSKNIELQSDINPEVIYYMHTRLDSRLNYEDRFINNISLANFISTEDERLNYKVISELKDNTYLIETEWPWLWGDSRYGYFVINVDKGYLRLVDNYITESVSPPINSYKINDDRVLIEIDNKKISLLFNNT
jgi:hypothetical protein